MRLTLVLAVLICAGLLLVGCDQPATPLAMLGGAQTATADPGAAAERTFENDEFILTVPAGWGMRMSGRDYYDLGTTEVITFHDDPLITEAGAFLTISVDTLEAGADLQSRVDAAYAVQQTAIEEMAQQPYEQDGLTGIEATYRRPWGEPWWRFRDVWFEVDGVCYLLSFQASPNTFEDNAEVFDAILKSFRFK